MIVDNLQFIAWHWLLLIPLIWMYLLYWYRQPLTKESASIADVDLSAYNQFYHPYTNHLIAATQKNTRPESHQPYWKNPKFWLHGILFSLLSAALAQPFMRGKRLPDPPPERDIVFLVDTSLSMQLKDYQQNGKPISRMALLRSLLVEFSSRMKGEKISIILFAEKPYILVPLTNEQSLIKRMLGRITTTLAGRYAVLGEALLMALNDAKKHPDRHRTFILFSDENTSRGEVTASAAAQIVGEHGIPIYTIGIGSSEVNDGSAVSGGLFQSVDLALLEDIAKRSKGQSYQVNNTNAMEQALADIFKQRQNIALAKPHYERKPLYFYPLSLAILALIIWQLTHLLKQNWKTV